MLFKLGYTGMRMRSLQAMMKYLYLYPVKKSSTTHYFHIMIKRTIPSSGETIPIIGLGTWKTFDVPEPGSTQLQQVLDTLHSGGGRLIDSSPMYGRSEHVIGELTSGMPTQNDFFYATKVWTRGHAEGLQQMEASLAKMKRQNMDLIQIHNLVDWKTHLPELRRWKESGKTRYIGITHYLDSSHEELEKIIRSEKLDFVQFNYSIASRNAEKRLLGAAQDSGVATLINRPFGEGAMFNKVKGKSLPAWAGELGIKSWSAYFLKYIAAHPAVTCIIPATGSPAHEADNIKAGENDLPDEQTRKKMVNYLGTL
jgi:diketogulonate reductase-like aldo/keto reductase